MGTVHAICHASGLGITSYAFGSACVVLVARDGDTFKPIALPICGEYDDFGRVRKPTLTDVDRAIVRGVLDMRARGEIWWSDTARISSEISEPNLAAIVDEIRQGMIVEHIRDPGGPSSLMRANGVPLHFVYMLARVFDAVVEMQRDALSAEQRKELDDRSYRPFDALCSAALGLPSLSRRLLADTPRTRDELVRLALFRSWFDRHRSWQPALGGEQFFGNDLCIRAKAVRPDLASWPALLAMLDRYDAQVAAEVARIYG
jgi:hypothetical protein